MIPRLAPCVAALMIVASPALAGPLALSYFSDADDEGAVLIIYDPEFCDREIAGECAFVTLRCSRPDYIGITLNDVSNKELALWLTQKDKMTLTVTGLPLTSEPSVTQIHMNEMSGSWDVVFETGFPKEVAMPRQMVFEASPRSVTIELLRADDRLSFDDFIRACQRMGRKP